MCKRVLVTGGGGFIGSHLIEELVKEGYDVRALVHYNFQNNWGWLETLSKDVMANVEVFPSDIRDPFAVRKSVKDCELVFHLAALIAIPYSYFAPASYIETNVLGTLNVLQACLEEGTPRLVHTSTSETYGTAQYLPIDENHPLVAQSPYAGSKIGADKLAESYYLSFGLPVATIRPFNAFGPRQSARAIIPTIISQALCGAKKIFLGSLSPVRDFTYVKDTVRGFIAIARSRQSVGQTINIGTGQGIGVGDLARVILRICGSSATIESDDRRVRPETSEVRQLISDNRRARKIAGWQPCHSLEEGLEETVCWMQIHLERYKSHTYNL